MQNRAFFPVKSYIINVFRFVGHILLKLFKSSIIMWKQPWTKYTRMGVVVLRQTLFTKTRQVTEFDPLYYTLLVPVLVDMICPWYVTYWCNKRFSFLKTLLYNMYWRYDKLCIECSKLFHNIKVLEFISSNIYYILYAAWHKEKGKGLLVWKSS